jgi:hypothetical protein
MWIITIAGYDTGISISASSYERALIAAIHFMVGETGVMDADVVDVVAWEYA